MMSVLLIAFLVLFSGPGLARPVQEEWGNTCVSFQTDGGSFTIDSPDAESLEREDPPSWSSSGDWQLAPTLRLALLSSGVQLNEVPWKHCALLGLENAPGRAPPEL